jgi:hypothetical protein
MKRSLWLILALFVAAVPARAQEPEPLKVLSPYMSDDSFVVGWVDVRNVDLKASFERLRKIGVDPNEIDEASKKYQAIQQRLLESGVTRVYVTNVGGILQPELLFVAGATDPQAVKGVLNGIPKVQARVAGNTVVFGTAQAIGKSEKRPGKASPEWRIALAKATGPSQLVFLPPRAFLKAYSELQPDLPAVLGGGATGDLVDAIRWARVDLDLSANVKLDFAIQMKDETAAKNVEAILGRAIGFAKRTPHVAKIPGIEKFLTDHPPLQAGEQIKLTLDSAAIDTVIGPLLGKAHDRSAMMQSMNNLKQMALAMHVHHDRYKTFPPQTSIGKDKKPLLSWRVHILPFIEEEQLYKEFHLDEPWDSEHNKKLIAKMPKVYASPLSRLKTADGKTTYVVPAGPKLVFDGGTKTTIAGIPDGTSNTILILDVDDSKAVTWTQPEDYPVEEKKANVGLVRPGVGRILAAFCDGSVRLLSGTTPDEVLWFYFCPSDGNVIPEEK